MRYVVADDEGKMYKSNAMELSRIFGNMKLQEKYIDDFVDYLEKQRDPQVLNV